MLWIRVGCFFLLFLRSVFGEAIENHSIVNEEDDETIVRLPLEECRRTLWNIEWPYKYINYNEETYEMSKIVQKMLQIGETPLDQLHTLLNEDKSYGEEEEPYYHMIPEFGKNDRKSVFVKKFLNVFDKEYTLLNAYIQFLLKEIKPLFPEEDTILVQKTPNVRIHIPGNTNIGTRESDPNESIIGIHCDSEFNHPKGEVNIVLPLTDMFESNGIYFEPEPVSDIDPMNYPPMKMNKGQFFIGHLNVMKHYNKINKTGKTRVSLDFRVLPLSKYVASNHKRSATGKNKFLAGDYYMML